jgi:hypothetical protein
MEVIGVHRIQVRECDLDPPRTGRDERQCITERGNHRNDVTFAS